MDRVVALDLDRVDRQRIALRRTVLALEVLPRLIDCRFQPVGSRSRTLSLFVTSHAAPPPPPRGDPTPTSVPCLGERRRPSRADGVPLAVVNTLRPACDAHSFRRPGFPEDA